MKTIKFISTMNKYEILTLLISVCALFMSYVALNNTTNYAVKEKQADAVMELVQYLGKTPVSITFSVRSDSSTFYSNENYTLLELSYTKFYSKLDSAAIYFDVSDALPIDLRDFSNNPYMPSSIADVLTKYYSYRISLVSDSIEQSDNSIVLRNYDYKQTLSLKRDSARRQGKQASFQQPLSYHYYLMRNAPAYKNWAVFKKSNKLLLDAIKRWLDKHKIDEVNIPTDHLEYAI